ncbi:MAG TPA: hypothetical protein PLR75_02160 [Candidatus Pacearchaeota archaeon]|nr:hypothetical protein [Candidatus Pacearchaeota archaeon]
MDVKAMEEEIFPILRDVGAERPTARLRSLQSANRECGPDLNIWQRRASGVLARYLIRRGLIVAATEEQEEENAGIVAAQIVSWLNIRFSHREIGHAAVWLACSWEEGFDPETTWDHLLSIEGKMVHLAEIGLAILRAIDLVFGLGISQSLEKTYVGREQAIA